MKRLDELLSHVAPRFSRVEPRQHATAYVRGLLRPLPGSNFAAYAGQAGKVSADAMQRLLNSASWDTDGVRDDICSYVAKSLGAETGTVVVDETGFVRKGRESAGVARQHLRLTGRDENCQVGIFLVLVTPLGHALIDRELYLPESWFGTDDDAKSRRAAAAIPDSISFRTKSELAQRMLDRALDSDVPFSWVAAAEACGWDGSLARWCARRRLPHVVAVAGTQPLVPQAQAPTVGSAVARSQAPVWKSMRGESDAEPARSFQWAIGSFDDATPKPIGWDRRLLARRSGPLEQGDKIGELQPTYYLSAGPITSSDAELVRAASALTAAGECLSLARERAGLSNYQVRHHAGWYRHITLSMLAVAHVEVPGSPSRIQQRSGPADVITWHE
jgi:hypothetical protein